MGEHFHFRVDRRHLVSRKPRKVGERDDIEARILMEQERIYREWMLEDPKAAEKWWRMPQITKEQVNAECGRNRGQRKKPSRRVQRGGVQEKRSEPGLPVLDAQQGAAVQSLLPEESEGVCQQSP